MQKEIRFIFLGIAFLTVIFSPVSCSIQYVKGDLDYINGAFHEKEIKTPDEDQHVVYRVNVADVSSLNSSIKIKNMINEEFKKLLKRDALVTEKALGDNSDRFFINVSLTSNMSQTQVEKNDSILTGVSLGLYPYISIFNNVYYAIDIYDKKEVDILLQKVNEKLSSSNDSKIYNSSGNVEISQLTYNDLDISTLKPLASYEYRHEITNRTFIMLSWPFGFPFIPFLTTERALKKILIDMNNQFAADLEIGFNSAVTHRLQRDGYGIFLTQNQIQSEYADTANDILKSMGSGISTFNNNLMFERKYISKYGMTEARQIGREIKSENILSEKLADKNKNYYMLFYKKKKTDEGYAFGSMSNSLEKLNLEKYKGKQIKIKRAYFNSENELKAWIQNYQKGYSSSDY